MTFENIITQIKVNNLWSPCKVFKPAHPYYTFIRAKNNPKEENMSITCAKWGSTLG